MDQVEVFTFPGGRGCLGLVLALLGLALIAVGLRLDWGVAVTCVLPGLLLLFPATALLLSRRHWRAARGCLLDLPAAQPLAGCAVEIVPTAGWPTVLLHRPDARPLLLGAWLPPRQAAALVEWLDQQAGAPLPRRAPMRARWDR